MKKCQQLMIKMLQTEARVHYTFNIIFILHSGNLKGLWCLHVCSLCVKTVWKMTHLYLHFNIGVKLFLYCIFIDSLGFTPCQYPSIHPFYYGLFTYCVIIIYF